MVLQCSQTQIDGSFLGNSIYFYPFYAKLGFTVTLKNATKRKKSPPEFMQAKYLKQIQENKYPQKSPPKLIPWYFLDLFLINQGSPLVADIV